jgi:uncharacterized RDD family membrane protein YckC
MKKLSLYKNNENVTFSRRVIIFLFDYIIMLFITMSIFLLVEFITFSFKTSKLNQLQINTYNYQVEIINIMEESNLGFKEDNSINDSSVISDKFIHTLVYTSLNENVEKKDVYNNKILKNNPIGYYYGEYKINNCSNYKTYSEQFVGYNYVNNRLLETINQKEEILYINDNEVFLFEKYAKALDNLISMGNDSIVISSETINGSDIYSVIYKGYNELLQEAKEDLIINNNTYMKSFELFNNTRQSLIEYKWIEIIIIYAVLSFIYFFVVPILNEKNTTLSMLLFGMATCSTDGYKIGTLSKVLKYISEFFMYFNVLCIIVIFLYNTNSQIFIRHNLLGFISMIDLYIISIIYLIISFICSSLKSTNHQTIGDKISKQLLKDVR